MIKILKTIDTNNCRSKTYEDKKVTWADVLDEIKKLVYLINPILKDKADICEKQEN